MTTLQQLEFWESDKVKTLLTNAVADGNISIISGDVRFNLQEMHDVIAYVAGNTFVLRPALKRFANFVRDVVFDKFDVSTLTNKQIKALNERFGRYDKTSSLLHHSDYYCESLTTNNTVLTVIPKYFSLIATREIKMYDNDVTPERAYDFLVEEIKTANDYAELEAYYEVFVNKIKTAYKNLELIKQVTK